MKRLVFFFALIALFAVNKVSAATDNVIERDVTCIDNLGNRYSVKMQFQIISPFLKYLRIYRDPFDTGKNSLLDERSFDGCEIIVPEKIGEYTVIAVGRNAFVHCKAKITLPESVTSIEKLAFGLYEYDGYDFTLPSKVKSIGDAAFQDSNIRGISLNPNLKTIGNAAFYRCENLRELIIPKSVNAIGMSIIEKCKELERLEVESGNNNYHTPAGSNVIMETQQKMIIAACNTSRIPKDTYRIDNSAFAHTNLVSTTITIPESVNYLGPAAFAGSNIERLIVRSESVEMEYNAFHECEKLKRIDFYSGNVSLGSGVFEDCTALESVYCWSHKPNIKPYANQFYNIGPNWKFGNSKVKLYAKWPKEYTDRFEGANGDLVWQNWFNSNIRDISEAEQIVIIDEVHITDFDWPVAGKDADYTATSLTPYATVSNIKYQMYLGGWKEIDPKPASLGDKYSIGFTITLGNAPHGQCEFTDDVKLYIDDREADLRITSSATETQMTFVVDNYVVPAPPGGVPIKKAYVNVAEPVQGQPLSTTVTAPTGKPYQYAGYRIDTVFWGCVADASLESYDPTKGYTLAAILTAKQDYCFGADCTFTLNGKTASVIRSRTAEGRERVMLALGFGDEEPVKPDTTYITTLNLTVAEPVEGEVPVAEVISPTAREMEAMGYTIAYSEWIEAGESWDSFEAATEPYDPKQAYPLVIVLYADETTVFVEDMTVTINGRKPEVYLSTNSAGKGTATLVLKYSGYSDNDKEVYTEFVEETGTLTYYYDNRRSQREGVTELYDPVNDPYAARFIGYNEKVLKAVIDKSMKDAPLTATWHMFYGWGEAGTRTLSNMTEIKGLTYLNTANVINMNEMFAGCNSLQTVDVSSFDVSKVRGMEFMFSCCYKLTTIYCNKDWSTGTASSISMFSLCNSLVGGEGTTFDNAFKDKTYARPDGGKYMPGYFTLVTRKRGDVNDDGSVNTADVVATYSFIEMGEASGFDREAADVNNDGSVNTADVVAIYSIIIKGE